jgi:hypothetical protein
LGQPFPKFYENLGNMPFRWNCSSWPNASGSRELLQKDMFQALTISDYSLNAALPQ